MNKVTLSIDMPDNCDECPLSLGYICVPLKTRMGVGMMKIGRLGDCPLIPLPEKDVIPPSVTSRKAEFGWIRCIEEILGEK